ncbi:hypothetical protein [Legionella cincinnatiensis]|uniref:Uncharacterized protein n=1 Tax=Legionella cincinnatiensis TaxID=28085 RepID=A0A378IJ70_9GAMM|nr:hypothetical protein [Legionella cincinnatiensis]KTC78631.1 hypothetical protein Lcin_3246 [Legionella cincinnatiensis]STX35219.1 Uncharacterised protein [Legionella cincinnatiensis]
MIFSSPTSGDIAALILKIEFKEQLNKCKESLNTQDKQEDQPTHFEKRDNEVRFRYKKRRVKDLNGAFSEVQINRICFTK